MTDCLEGYENEDGDLVCTLCNANSLSNGRCCTSVQYFDTDTDACASIPTNCLNFDHENVICLECDATHYLVTENNTCCLLGEYWSIADDACQSIATNIDNNFSLEFDKC